MVNVKSLVLVFVFLSVVSGNALAEEQKELSFQEMWDKAHPSSDKPAPKVDAPKAVAPKAPAAKPAAAKVAKPKAPAEPKASAPKAHEPAPTPPAAPEPKVEAPKAEEPPPPPAPPEEVAPAPVAAPEPKVEAPKAEEPPPPAPKVEAPQAQEPPPPPAPPAAPAPKVEAPKAQEAAPKPSPSSEKPGFAGTVGSAEKEAKIHEHEEGLVAPVGITGNWGGLRDKLEANGVTIKGVYTGEFAHTYLAGTPTKSETIYHDNLDLTMNVDTEKAGLWKGGTFWVYGLRNHGSNPSSRMIGDLQGASNISVPKDQFIVNEAWYNQDFADGAVSALAGLHNLNSEFCISTNATIFLNSSFGIEPEISGNVPVSIFPQAGLGVRLRVKPVENVYVQAAVYDGDPSTREWKSSDGNMTIAEAGYIKGASDYKVGYWRHSAEKTYGGVTFSDDNGMYGIIDQEVFQFDNAEHSSASVFLQYGSVPEDRNAITGYMGYGIHLHGLIPTRSVDDLGFGVANAKTHVDTEVAYELTYRLVATSWLAIRPSFQWIKNPGGDPAVSSVNVGFLRFEIQL